MHLMGMMVKAYVGTAGWSVPKSHADYFKVVGSHLVRYASRLSAVEINSSFYREHQAKTYARWARETPEQFRFSVKLSKRFTHEEMLDANFTELKASLENIQGLGEKFGVLLIQLPPSLDFQVKRAVIFFKRLRSLHQGKIALEPRHVTWSGNEALKLLTDFSVSKVIADPERVEISDSQFMKFHAAGKFIYRRLHGSPVIYRSQYSVEFVRAVQSEMRDEIAKGLDTWCIYDNTTFGHAIEDAIRTQSTSDGITGLKLDTTSISRRLR